MAFNAGAITTSLDFEFSASAKRTLAQYEQALKKAQTKVNSELGVTVDQKGFQKYQGELKKAKKDVDSELGAKVDETGFRKFRSEVDKADKETADAELGAKVDKRGFQDYNRETDKVGRSSEDVDRKARKAGGGMTALAGSAKVLAGGAALGGVYLGLKKIVTIGVEFENQANTFQAVSGATVKQMDEVLRRAKQLGNDAKLPGASAADALEVMTNLAKAGLNVKNSQDAARDSLQLATAAEVENARAAEFMGDALNMFNLKGKDARLVADSLAGGANASTAEITDMADSLKMAGAVANQSNLTLPETVTLLSELAKQGIKGSDAGTSLKQMLLSLNPNSKEAAEAFMQLGVNAYDAQGQMKPIRQIILEMNDALVKLSPEKRASALKTIFGSDAIRAANIIFGQGTKGFDAMKKNIDKTGQAADLAASKSKGVGGAWENIKSTLETAAISISQKFGPTLEKALRFIGKLLGDVFSGKGQFGKFAKEAGEQFSKFIEALKPAAPFLQNVLGPLLKGLVKGLLAGFIGVIKVIVPIVKVLAKVLGFLGEKAKPLRGIFEKVGEVIGFFLAGPIIFKALSFLGKLVKIFGAVGKAAAGFGRKVGAVVGDVVGFVGRMIGGYTRFQKKTASTFLNAARDVGGFVSKVGRWFRELPNTIVRAFAGLGGKIVRPFSSAFKTLRSAITKALGWIKGAFNDAIDWVRGAYDKLPGFVKKGLGAVSKGASAVGGLLGLSEGGKVGPASGGPQMFIAGEGGKDEWVISQEGDRRKNQMLLMEAAATIGLPMFKKGGKPKKKQSTKSLRNQVKSINNQQTRQQENIDLLGIQAQLDGTQTAGESMGINAAQARMLSLYAKERDRIRRLLAALDGDMGRVRGQIGSARGTRRDRLQEKYAAMRDEKSALRDRLRELNSSIRLGNAQLMVDQNAASAQAATEQTDAASVTQYDTAITMAKAQAALSGDNSGIAPLVKARLEELRNRLSAAINQNNPALASALTDAVTSAKSEYESYLGDTGGGLGFTTQVSNLMSARTGLYTQAGNAFGGSMRTTNNKKVVNLTVNGLTQVSDPHLWARRVGAELALV